MADDWTSAFADPGDFLKMLLVHPVAMSATENCEGTQPTRCCQPNFSEAVTQELHETRSYLTKQHFLNFLPLPQMQESLRPTF